MLAFQDFWIHVTAIALSFGVGVLDPATVTTA